MKLQLFFIEVLRHELQKRQLEHSIVEPILERANQKCKRRVLGALYKHALKRALLKDRLLGIIFKFSNIS